MDQSLNQKVQLQLMIEDCAAAGYRVKVRSLDELTASYDQVQRTMLQNLLDCHYDQVSAHEIVREQRQAAIQIKSRRAEKWLLSFFSLFYVAVICLFYTYF